VPRKRRLRTHRVRIAWGDDDVNLPNLIVATAEQTEVVDSARGLGIGAIALLTAVALILAWMA